MDGKWFEDAPLTLGKPAIYPYQTFFSAFAHKHQNRKAQKFALVSPNSRNGRKEVWRCTAKNVKSGQLSMTNLFSNLCPQELGNQKRPPKTKIALVSPNQKNKRKKAWGCTADTGKSGQIYMANLFFKSLATMGLRNQKSHPKKKR